MRTERREEPETAAALRDQLRAAEAGIDVPDGLWDRIRAPREGRALSRTPAQTYRRPLPFAVIAVAATAVVLVIFGTWWLVSPSARNGSADGSPAAGHDRHAVTLRVHNAEAPCRKLRTMECALRIAKNPYVPYADAGNMAGHVWHGDKLSARCVVTDGRLVKDESGLSSTRWYRVTKPGDKVPAGWLPGVRTRNTTEVPVCTGAERPPGSGS